MNPHVSLEKLLLQMKEWPQSWAGFPEDIPYGQQLCAQMIPFVRFLHAQGFTTKTLRTHLANLWAIGGEIIRDINEDNAARKTSPQLLLKKTIKNGQAPLLRNATENEQRSCDATARKLNKFLDNLDF